MKGKKLINVLLGMIIMLSIGALGASAVFANSAAVAIDILVPSVAFVPVLLMLIGICVEALVIVNKKQEVLKEK